MEHILLTGFEPFGGDQRNPSLEAARIVEKQHNPDQFHLTVAPLPVEFAGARTTLKHLITTHQPTIVVCVGLAAGRTDISFERVAINVADARIPDNAGFQPLDEPLSHSGAPAYFSTLPNKRAIEALRELDIPASLSNTAGTYVCNAALYYLLEMTDAEPVRGTFIHVPDVFAHEAPMSLDDVARAIHEALSTFAAHTSEVEVHMGQEF